VDQPRPTLLGGFWALLSGGLLVAATLLYTHPIVDPSHCPNAGAAGNASAFTDPAWDVRLPVLLLAWLLLIALEQASPTTWRHRTAATVTARAAGALTLAMVASCALAIPLETVCR
jgi:hypothetical protein